jgi:glycerophosphoryl diester phosphodiesterase
MHRFHKIARQLVGACLLAVLVASLASAAEPARPLVVGHRGLMHAAPECTLAGFKACLALRVGFEFDVRRTKDGELVCLHDPTLDRTTNGRGKLTEQTLAALRLLDAGSRFNPAFRHERVPSVEEIVALVGGQAHEETLIAVDMKETGGGIEAEVVRLAQSERAAFDRLLFIGATIESAEVRQRLRAADPHAHTARLAATADQIADALADKSADWVYFRFVPSRDDMTRIRGKGKRVFVAGPLFAGKQPANWQAASDAGVDAILTDFPLELARQLRSQDR